MENVVLKELRARAGLTQQEAAALLGVSYRTYQRWEAGENKRPVRDVYLDKLRQARHARHPTRRRR